MNTAVFVFHGELNDLISRTRRGLKIPVTFKYPDQTAKHLIESLGVPHVEIGGITANGISTNQEYLVQDGDYIEVHPNPPGCPIEPRFILDNHLGRLAAHLRMLGFDCLYRNDFEDTEMVGMISADIRILLTRDRQLLMRKVVQYGYCLRSLEPDIQLREILYHFDLGTSIHPFRRCLRCNGALTPVEKNSVISKLQPLTRKYYNDFSVCHSCKQIYWKGSHYDKMQALIAGLKLEHNPD
jgi:uncharacterized protein